AFAEDGLGQYALRRHLDGHQLAGLAVASLVDGGHAALADLGEELILSQRRDLTRRSERPHRRVLLMRTAFWPRRAGFSSQPLGIATPHNSVWDTIIAKVEEIPKMGHFRQRPPRLPFGQTRGPEEA